ncbi:hypothetical protein DFQ30_003938 [Apophysomyces sp. BC1015]|nr:hypothetical protein DFQ30_003938 [Apophysomyces sp. BC1015]
MSSKKEPVASLPDNPLPPISPSLPQPTQQPPDIFDKGLVDVKPKLWEHMNAHHTSTAPRPFDEDRNMVVIDDSNHYTYLVVIASEAGYLSRRRLIRQHYFGLHDNLVPCMHHNTDVYYKFWIHGGQPESGTSIKRRYEAEKMEWDDIVEMPSNMAFEQANVLDWVHTALSGKGITYDYLIIQDIHTFAHISTIKRELDSGVVSDNTDSPVSLSEDAALNMIWGTFRNDHSDKHFTVIGRRASELALQYHNNNFRQQQENVGNSTSIAGGHLFTRMYNYYTTHRSALEAALDQTIQEPELAEAERERTIPEFIREDGPEGTHRFIRWENNVESVHAEDIVVTHVYQDTELVDLVGWTHLRPTHVCYSPAAIFQSSHPQSPSEPLDDDEDPEEDEDDETVYFKNAPMESPSVAVVTSSYLYDTCMEPSATAAATNKRDYAQRHGYAFVARSAEFAQQVLHNNRKAVWGKIDVVQKVLPKYEWVFWLDMDAVVMDQTKSIQDLLSTLRSQFVDGRDEFERSIDLVIARPSPDKMINAGVFLMRNSVWANNFLRDLQNLDEWHTQGPFYEQGAMWQLLNQPNNRKHVLLLDKDNHTFNTLPKFYRPGNFVLHLAPDRCPNDAVLKALATADMIRHGKLSKP